VRVRLRETQWRTIMVVKCPHRRDEPNRVASVALPCGFRGGLDVRADLA
jgi:hypothetical protein